MFSLFGWPLRGLPTSSSTFRTSLLPIDFTSSRAGTVERIDDARGIYHAFVPAALPPAIGYSDALVGKLSEADAVLGQLSATGGQLPNPQVLLVSYIRREAVLSSRIEGTLTSIADVFADEAVHALASDDDPAVQEVRNYISALELGVEWVQRGRLIDREMVLALHRVLMTGVRGRDKQPGEFRTVQNWIGRPGSSPATAVFVPPHPGRVHAAIEDWQAFSEQGSRRLPPLISCGVLHAYFETVHPFLDGNGRIGRLLIPLHLIACGRLSAPLLYISAYLETHKADYARHLQAVRTHGAWETWIEFLIDGVAETAQEGQRRAAAIIRYYDETRDLLDGVPHSGRLLRALMTNPFISTTRAVQTLSVTSPTARKALDTFVRRGVLEDAGKRGRTPLLLARSLLELFGESPL